jgi:GNAT superfamily N-acetyltransferase
VIRLATEADAPLVQELWQAFNAEVPDAPWRDDDADEFRPDATFLGDNDGFAALTRLGARAWFLDVVYVRPGARGKGLGAALVRAAAEHVRAQGADVLELEVLQSNEAALRLYERLGFATFERTLAAPVELLLRDGEGATFGAVHVQTDDADTVRRNVDKYLPRLARGATAEVAAGDSWVRIRSDAIDSDPVKLKALAKELSYTSGGVTLSLGVESGAVVRYTLFDRGSMVDEYASLPEFHGPLPPGDVIALGANPTVVARLTGADPQRVREVARTASSPAELPPAEDLYRELAELLGVDVG